jgi:hypothetical protein
MPEAQRNAVDSAVLGRTVLDLRGVQEGTDFSAFEGQYRAKHDPSYVVCKLPAEELAAIHLLEDHGFRFIEFQMRLRGTIKKAYDHSAFGYTYTPVTGHGPDLDAILEIAGEIFEHDRFSRDPYFRQFPNNISGERYRRYVLQSMSAPDESVYKLEDSATGEIAGFGTHRVTGPDTAVLLIGGVRNRYKGSGLGMINDRMTLNALHNKGIKSFLTHISGCNYPILDLEVRALGYRVQQSFVVLRKAYD